MKKYILNIKTIKSDKGIAIFNVLIMSITIFALLSYYGNLKGKQYHSFLDNSHQVYAEVNKELIDKTIDRITVDMDTSFTYVIQSSTSFNFNSKLIVPTTISDNFDFLNNISGKTLSGDPTTNEILVHSDFLIENELSLDDTISINNKKFTIVGSFVYTLNPSTIIFGLESFKEFESDYTLFEIIIQPVSEEEIFSKTIITLNDIFNGSLQYQTFKQFSSSYLNEFKLYTLILFIASTINFLYIYEFIVSRRENRFRVYNITGGSSEFLTRFIIVDLFFMFSVSYLISIVLTLISNTILIPQLISTYSFYLTVSDFVLYYFLLFSIYLVFILVYRQQSSKKKAIRKRGRFIK